MSFNIMDDNNKKNILYSYGYIINIIISIKVVGNIQQSMEEIAGFSTNRWHNSELINYIKENP